MSTLNQHIEKNKDLLDNPTISSQYRRHVEEELQALETYKKNHPEDDHDPTSLELYCELHPDALRCKIYDN